MAVEAARILRALPTSGVALLRAYGCEIETNESEPIGARALIAMLVDALQASPAYPEIEHRLADIDTMSDWLGEACLREAVHEEAPHLIEAFSRREGAHERAALVQAEEPAVFERACRRRYFSRNRLLKKCCARFRTVARPDWNPSSGLDGLMAMLQPLLHNQLRTGESIVVDPIIRKAGAAGAFVQLSLYAAGSAQSIEEVEGEQVIYRVIRPAFVCVIGYWPNSGNLEVVVRNGAFALRAAIAVGFVRAALGATAEDLQTMVEPTVTLDGLLARPILDFDIEDGIVAAKLIELDVSSMACAGAAITLFARSKAATVWDSADEFVRDAALLAGIATRAKVQVEHVTDGSRRRRSITFELTPPNGYTPRGETEMQRLIIDKYLPRWGLMAAGETPPWT